jgi:hypothetical protein
VGKEGNFFGDVLEVWDGEFIMSILWCRESGNDLWEDLAKFSYKLKCESKNLLDIFLYLWLLALN